MSDAIGYARSPGILRREGAAFFNSRVLSQGIAVTAATSGSKGVEVADNDVLDFGTGDFSGVIGVRLADYTPSVGRILEQKHDGSNGRVFSLQASGVLRLTINGTDYDSTVATGLTNDTAHLLGYSVTRETAAAAGEVIFTVDGVQLGDAVAITAGAPTTVNNAVSQYVMGTSTTRTSGVVFFFVLYSYALTVAEHLSLYRNGIAEADKWSEPIYESDFSAGVDGWVASDVITDATIAGNIDTDADGAGQPPSDDWLRLTVNSDNDDHFAQCNNLSTSKSQFAVGTYFVPSGQSNVDGICISYYDGAAINRVYFSTVGSEAQFSVGPFESASITLAVIAADDESSSFQDAGGDDVFYVKDVVIRSAGAVLALEPEGVLEERWLDSSSNGLDASYPSAGASLVRSLDNIKSTAFIWSAIMGD